MAGYPSSIAHLMAELERIDLLIQSQVYQARQIVEGDPDLRGLYLSEAEIDRLLTQPTGKPRWAEVPLPQFSGDIQTRLRQIADGIQQRVEITQAQGLSLRLPQLQRIFGLGRLETDIVLIALAPEIDLRYERLYAYLQDDVTKKWPRIELIMHLLDGGLETQVAIRNSMAPSAPLLKYHLVTLMDDPTNPQGPWLGKGLKVDQRIVSFLLGEDDVAPQLLAFTNCQLPNVGWEDLSIPRELKRGLESWLKTKQKGPESTVFYCQGPYGVGKRAIASGVSQQLRLKLLAVKGQYLLETALATFQSLLTLIYREAQLQQAAVYWQDFDQLLTDEQRPKLEHLKGIWGEPSQITFLAGNQSWEPANLPTNVHFVRLELSMPTVAERWQLWQQALPELITKDLTEGVALASKFRLTAGQIRDAAATARNRARWRDPEQSHITVEDLYTACRLQSNQKLNTLAQKITPHYTWDDIVLPDMQKQQLQEICNCVQYRAQVYEQWGFGNKLALGKGLTVLFAGPSGTGKTMAADIIAGSLGLDLYKIDLSAVVSKYIGETETNLARIFHEAETSNAILFFDEADALFGKRSEVRDAHDRYANIETGYLLQRIETFEGVAILATNLSKNLDAAFRRRIQHTVEFPFPDAALRRQIWTRIWPAAIPCDNLDLDFVAQRFDIAGGHIRNVALAAAFLAASDGGRVTNAHLMRATQREYQKMGKKLMAADLGDYAQLLD